MKKYIFLLLTCFCFSDIAMAQVPAKQENKAGFRSQVFGGLILHTNGWGGNLTYAKFKTYKKYNLFSLDIVNIQDPKEYRIRYQVSPGSFTSSFKYGKINSLYNIRFGFGRQILLFEKQREKGVEIYANWKTGLNLGLVKPMYLEIVNNESGSNINVIERYNPDIHNESNIFGRASLGRGLFESVIAPGVHLKGGFKFEWANNRENILALETGVMIDFFPTGVPILAYQDEEVLFYNFYIHILIGKKYYN